MDEFYFDPFINLHNVNVVTSVQFCVVQNHFTSLSFIFENHLINYNAVEELCIPLNQEIFHSSSHLFDRKNPSIYNFPELPLRLFLRR